MKKHVTSKELSKKMEELGFPQVSKFYWTKEKGEWIIVGDVMGGIYKRASKDQIIKDFEYKREFFSAYLSTELGEWLQKYLGRSVWLSEISNATNDAANMIDEANNRAKMLIYLAELKIINPSEL